MNKVKAYLLFPSKAPYAWAIYLYIWLVLILLGIVSLGIYGKSLTMTPALADEMLFTIVSVSGILLIAAFIQIVINLQRYWRGQYLYTRKQFLINLVCLLGIVTCLVIVAFGD